MTLFAFNLGAPQLVPLIIASDAGAQMRQGLGTDVYFGMIGVAFFGLLLTPVFYVSVRWVVANVRGKRGSRAEGRAGEVEHATS